MPQAPDLTGCALDDRYELHALMVVQSGPGRYQIKLSPGSDTARWSIEVEDYH
jgi:hypothetical protein